jgi:hypothetical protein
MLASPVSEPLPAPVLAAVTHYTKSTAETLETPPTAIVAKFTGNRAAENEESPLESGAVTNQTSSANPASAYPVMRTVKRGDDLVGLCEQIYGFCDPQLLNWIKQNNPGMKSIHHIYIDQNIAFPEPPLIDSILNSDDDPSGAGH